jgi:hypothetical protein
MTGSISWCWFPYSLNYISMNILIGSEGKYSAQWPQVQTPWRLAFIWMTYEVKFRLTESTDLVPYRHKSVNAVQGSNQCLYLGTLWYTQESVWSNGGLAALVFKRLDHTDVENCSDDGDWEVQYLGDWFRIGFRSVSLDVSELPLT